jgi:hypothetical protein
MAPTSQRDWPFRREIVSRKPVSIQYPLAGNLFAEFETAVAKRGTYISQRRRASWALTYDLSS